MIGITYLLCFTLAMIQLFGHGTPDPIILAASLIAMAICSIAERRT